MSLTIKIGKAKARFSELVAKAEAGEEIIIARGHEPVARLVRFPDDFSALIAEVRAARAGRAKTRAEELIAWRHAGHQL
jgi:antitoxin (DNA-binding transcriptional repressor) of toxin-antitoxin stability system